MMTFATQVISGDYKSERQKLENFVAKKTIGTSRIISWKKIHYGVGIRLVLYLVI